ncbi:MAG: hypothetical protein DRN49_03430 [Thaumarchaeota archaeon]|nr:MAG: hypothetical protein DRN49_03430 [Nitrososphaerota archaeon]
MVIDDREIQVEGLEDLRRRITRLIGIGYRAFNWIVYSRQGRLNEILEPKREDMDAILQITLLREISEQLSTIIKDLKGIESEYRIMKTQLIPLREERVRELQREVNELNAELEDLKDSLRQAEDPAVKRLLKKVRELEGAKAMLLEAVNSKKSILARYGLKDPESIKHEFERLGGRLRDLEANLRSFEEEVKELRDEEAKVFGELKVLEDGHKIRLELKAKGMARCPTCGQKIDEEILSSIITDEKLRIRDLTERLEDIRESRKRLESELESLNREIDEVLRRRQRLNMLMNSISEYDMRISEKESIVKSLKLDVEGTLRRLGLNLGPDDPKLYEKLIETFQAPREIEEKRRRAELLEEKLKERRSELEKAVNELDNLKTRLRDLERKSKVISLASNLREKITDFIKKRREDLLRSIALRAQTIFMSLTDQRIYTSFRIDPENYRVYVKPHGLSDYIPASRVGGGHQTLISLSLRLAILYHLGVRSLIILDEPTYGVDEENLQMLLNQLSKIARHVDQALIITHYGRGVEEASNIIEVYRDQDGFSRIRMKF